MPTAPLQLSIAAMLAAVKVNIAANHYCCFRDFVLWTGTHALFGVDIGDIRYPFAVWPVHMKSLIEQILPVYLLLHLLLFSAAANLEQPAKLSHDS